MAKKKLKIKKVKKKYSDGGKTNPPIYTSNPNDPRLKSYQDSLDLYNLSKYQHDIEGGNLRSFSGSGNLPVPSSTQIGSKLNQAVRPGYNSLLASLGVVPELSMREMYDWERKGNNQELFNNYRPEESIVDYNQLKSRTLNPKIRIVTRTSPEFYHPSIEPTYIYNEENNTYPGKPMNYFYKQPVQPIVYRPEQNRPTYEDSLKLYNMSRRLHEDYVMNPSYNHLDNSRWNSVQDGNFSGYTHLPINPESTELWRRGDLHINIPMYPKPTGVTTKKTYPKLDELPKKGIESLHSYVGFDPNFRPDYDAKLKSKGINLEDIGNVYREDGSLRHYYKDVPEKGIVNAFATEYRQPEIIQKLPIEQMPKNIGMKSGTGYRSYTDKMTHFTVGPDGKTRIPYNPKEYYEGDSNKPIYTEKLDPVTQKPLKFGNGGKTSFEQFYNQVNPAFRDTTSYNLRGAYNELPYQTMINWKNDPKNNHLPDTYKLPSHPSFSTDSKYFNYVQPNIVNQGGRWQESEKDWMYIPFNPTIKDTIIEPKEFGGQLIENMKKKYKNGGKPCMNCGGKVMEKGGKLPKYFGGGMGGFNWQELLGGMGGGQGGGGGFGSLMNTSGGDSQSIDIQPSMGNMNWNTNAQFQAPQQQNWQVDPNQNPNLPTAPQNTPTTNVHKDFNWQQLGQNINQNVAQSTPQTFGSNYYMSKANDSFQKGNASGQKAAKAFASGDYANGIVYAVNQGANTVLSGINTAKSALEFFGNQRLNSRVKQREADLTRQSIYSDAENQPPYEQYGYGFSGRNPASFATGGKVDINDFQTFSNLANIEAEDKEVVLTPQGLAGQLNGDSHAKGGIPLQLPIGSMIFSEKLKHPDTKKSYSKMAKKFETEDDMDNLEDKRFTDKIRKETAELNIKLKTNELGKLFQEQEQNKLEGEHGKSVQKSTVKDYKMALGGLTKAVYGTISDNNPPLAGKKAIGEDNFKGDINQVYGHLKALGYKGSKNIGEMQKFQTALDPRKVSDYMNMVRPNNKAIEIWNQKYATTPTNNYKDVNMSLMTPEDRVKAFNDSLWDYRFPANDYNSPNVPQEKGSPEADVVNTNLADIATGSKSNSYGLQGIQNPIFLGIPQSYNRDALFTSQLRPQYINPRYLDIQPQLQAITRGKRALQMNLGDRSTTSVGNLAQSQINAYNQEQQAFGTKYNYDRGQDSSAEQFNAQAKMSTDQANLTERNRFFDQINKREGLLDTQKRTDRQGELNNMYAANQYANSSDYIQRTFNPWSYETGALPLTYPNTDLQKLYGNVDKEKRYMYDSNGKKVAEYTDEKKYGGKVKTKMKMKLKKKK